MACGAMICQVLDFPSVWHPSSSFFFLLDCKDHERHDIKPLPPPQLNKRQYARVPVETTTTSTSYSTGLPREKRGQSCAGCLFDQAPTGRKLARLPGIVIPTFILASVIRIAILVLPNKRNLLVLVYGVPACIIWYKLLPLRTFLLDSAISSRSGNPYFSLPLNLHPPPSCFFSLASHSASGGTCGIVVPSSRDRNQRKTRQKKSHRPSFPSTTHLTAFHFHSTP
ncbi:hypothetical protein J3F83DRAFT_604296 [Trichoderma novae-zelandiae]